ncbi:hypothetical protein MPH_04034 [Macrophomina phaseolina MS6]|uniref:Uncharacterized protein n=1 Tax=Macrophomina phaseolina (strain MS6) TaxID=1126212 RepID=K2RV64_MACPH|nr:hypothetical protein MPH_04034 [Macrophomina phaseolina MS6]
MLRYQHYVNRRVALKTVWPTLRAGMDGLNASSPELCLNHSFEPQYKRPSEMAARRAAVLGVDAGTLLRDIPLYRATEAAWLHALIAALEGEVDRYGKLLRAAQELDDYVVSLEVVLAMRRLEWELVHEDGGQCINGGNDDQEEDTETKDDL